VIEDSVAKYTGVVIAVDPARTDPAALAVGVALGAALGETELVTVSTGESAAAGRVALEQAAATSGLTHVRISLLVQDDAPLALLDHAGADRLLVIGCRAAHPMRLPGLGDVGRSVLAEATRPVLVVGPSVTAELESTAQIVVCAHGDRPSPATLDAVERWVHSFGSEQTWVAGVIPTSTDVTGDGAVTVGTWADALAERHVVARQQILNGGDPVGWLEHFAGDLTNAVYVASSDRYTDGRRHLHSTTRDLIRRGRHPVLVVPHRSRRN
jgi:hypothetical protein